MSYRLNRQALERLKSLVAAGKYADGAWSFSAEDSNAILGTPPNWPEYGKWFLGSLDGVSDSVDAGKTPEKSWYAYPYGKDGTVYLSAIRAIVADATAAGDGDVVAAANDVLATARQQRDDEARASCDPKDINSLYLSGGAVIKAAMDIEGKPGLPTFSMNAYNGGPLRLKGWQYPVVVDLEGVQGHEKPRPALRDHDTSKIVGHTDKISVTTGSMGSIDATGVMSGHGAHRDEVVNSGTNGFPWQVSIGARVIKNEFVPDGKTAEANSHVWDGPINIARRSSLGELTFCALGADDTTSARIAAKSAKGTSMKFKSWAKARGLVAADMDTESMKCAKALFKAMNPDVDPDDETEETDEDKKKAADATKKAEAEAAALAIKAEQDKDGHGAIDAKKIAAEINKEIRANAIAERKRIAALDGILTKYKPRIEAAAFQDIEAKAIEGEWGEDKLELECLRAARPVSKPDARPFGINTGAGSEPTDQIVAAACALSAGISEKYALQGLDDKQKEIVATRKVRQSFGSIYDICAFVAAQNGVHLRATRMNRDVLEAMQGVEVRRSMDVLDVQAAGSSGYSTMSLSGITENILNKALLQGYQMSNSIVGEICYETDTNDFKQFKRYRLTASGILAALGAAGELKSISLQDESYANQVKTQGVLLNIGRDILLNDDMGALTEAPTMLGRGSSLFREMQVFQAWLNAPSTAAPGASTGQTANSFNFFSGGAANYLSGGTSALSISSLTSAVQKFREQTDANSMPVMLQPDRLLVPPALEVAAQNLFNGANLVVGALGSTSSKSVEPNLNAHAGKYRPIVSPFLSAGVATKIATKLAGYPAGSDSAWALLTNPSGGFATVQIGYLRGQRTPIIERGEANFNTLGMAMRVYYDFGTALHDYRCGVYSAGA